MKTKKVLLSIMLLSLPTLIAGDKAFAHGVNPGCITGGCPTAYCVEVTCDYGNCKGQTSVCTCTGFVTCESTCHSMGPVYCCKDK
jgi:hypothetical protein